MKTRFRLSNPFILAPMHQINDIAFRILCKQNGCSLTYTWLLNPRTKEKIILEDRPAVQIATPSDLGVKEFIKNNYRLTCFVGLENSPTCGIHWGKHKVNKHQTESPNPVDKPDQNEPTLKGIMAEILSDEFAKEKIEVPFLEFPTQSLPDSEKRKKFWEDLKATVERNFS